MIRIIGLSNDPGPPTQKTIEYVEGTPEERARNVARSEAFWRNTEWLGRQWDRLLPDARGKYVAVANQQEFVAPTYAEARAWIEANHATDLGAFVEDVPRTERRNHACYPGVQQTHGLRRKTTLVLASREAVRSWLCQP